MIATITITQIQHEKKVSTGIQRAYEEWEVKEGRILKRNRIGRMRRGTIMDYICS